MRAKIEPFGWLGICCWLLLLCSLLQPACGAPLRVPAPFECQIEGGKDDNFRYVAAQCWLPSTEKIRGILCVVLHPDGTNGRVLADSYEWTRLAATYDCALVAVSIVESDDRTKQWCAADQGSGRAILAALDRFAGQSKRPDLATAHILMAGVCAAGQFSYEFAAFAPSRMLGFATIGGGKHRLEIAGNALRVPGLLVVTPDRGPSATANLQALALLAALESSRWREIEGMIGLYDKGGSQGQLRAFLQARLAVVDRRPNRAWPELGSTASPALKDFVTSDLHPLSFPGRPLPMLAIADGPQIEMVSRPDENVLRASFPVKSTAIAGFDNISIPLSAATKAVIQKTNDSEWRVDLEIDSTQIPSGAFRTELPVRFSKNGMPLLGGLQVPLGGAVQKDIYPSPGTIPISGSGSDCFARLRSRSAARISEVVVEEVNPNRFNARAEIDDDGSPRIILGPFRVGTTESAPVTGYIIVRAKSHETQRIKIPFYGSIKM